VTSLNVGSRVAVTLRIQVHSDLKHFLPNREITLQRYAVPFIGDFKPFDPSANASELLRRILVIKDGTLKRIGFI
jgi:hypothetical protein